jgi:hypothetical protein
MYVHQSACGDLTVDNLGSVDGAFLGTFAKLRKATISFVMSIRRSVLTHKTTRVPLDGFS